MRSPVPFLLCSNLLCLRANKSVLISLVHVKSQCSKTALMECKALLISTDLVPRHGGLHVSLYVVRTLMSVYWKLILQNCIFMSQVNGETSRHRTFCPSLLRQLLTSIAVDAAGCCGHHWYCNCFQPRVQSLQVGAAYMVGRMPYNAANYECRRTLYCF